MHNAVNSKQPFIPLGSRLGFFGGRFGFQWAFDEIKEAQHGLFTKHLLDALYAAAADKRYGNADSRITLSEIECYLDREMTYAARRHYGREQQAMVIGDPEKVIVILDR